MSTQNQAIAQRLIEEVCDYKKLVNLYTTAFPDLRFSIEEMVSDEDTLVMRWRSSGTHKGDLGGIAPTNKKIVVEGITINHIQNGKILDQQVSWDALGMMQQLGVVPLTGEARGRAA